MKNWKFIKVENKDTPELREKLRDIDEQIKNWEHAKGIDGVEKANTQKTIDDLKKERSEVQKEITTGNYYPGIKFDGVSDQELKNWIRLDEQDIREAQREMEKWKRHTEGDYSGDQYNSAMTKYNEAKKNKAAHEEELNRRKTGNEGVTVKISLFKSPSNHSWIPGINDRMIEGAPEFKGAWGKDEALKWTKEWAEKHGFKVGNKKTGNESIQRQEWSMFKGLAKDAEKEVGNSQKEFKSVEELDRWCKQNGYMYEERSKGYYSLTNGKDFTTAHVGNAYTPNPELIKVLEAWLHNRMSEQEARAKIMKITGDKNITDMMIHSPGGFIPVGNKGQWDSKKMVYAKWDDEKGRPSEEFAKITWLGDGKGGLVNVWKGSQMTSEKYGSNDLEELRRWAEQRIGNARLGKFLMEGGHTAELVEEGGKFIVKYDDGRTETFMTRKAAEAYLKVYSELYIGNKVGNKKTGNLCRARNAIKTKNGMGVSDLEAQIRKNKEFIRQQKMRMNGKSKPEQDDIAEGIREAEEEIDRMEMRIADLKETGNKKVGNLDTVEEGDYVTVRFQGELVDGVVRKVQGTQALVTIDNTDVWFPIRSLKESI